MITTAVILAAGLGSRLKDKTKEIPKGFIPIEGKTLIERSVDKLLEAGVRRIIIGTGHAAEVYDQYAKLHTQISCVKNDKYADTGSMFTLFNLKASIQEDFFLLESDLLYDKYGLTALNEVQEKNVILASGRTYSNDEVFIEANSDGYLVKMSKNQAELKNIFAELVGISKVSYSAFQLMCRFAEREFVKKPKLDYEYALVGISKEEPISIKKISDYTWCEIDDDTHLERAENIILPKIKEREKHV